MIRVLLYFSVKTGSRILSTIAFFSVVMVSFYLVYYLNDWIIRKINRHLNKVSIVILLSVLGIMCAALLGDVLADVIGQLTTAQLLR